MAPGFKDPDDDSKTAQKIIFRQVRVGFGLEGWDQLRENSWMNTETFGPGQARNVRWSKDRDFATFDFHIFENWNNNLKATLYKLGPEATTE